MKPSDPSAQLFVRHRQYSIQDDFSHGSVRFGQPALAFTYSSAVLLINGSTLSLIGRIAASLVFHLVPSHSMSHGTGGSFEGHYDTALALAEAGFVVAAATHTGDNYRDQSQVGRLENRPRHIKVVVDYMLAMWQHHEALDPFRVGMFGFSAGGFTALVAIG